LWVSFDEALDGHGMRSLRGEAAAGMRYSLYVCIGSLQQALLQAAYTYSAADALVERRLQQVCGIGLLKRPL
jgi:hypothetical protein